MSGSRLGAEGALEGVEELRGLGEGEHRHLAHLLRVGVRVRVRVRLRLRLRLRLRVRVRARVRVRVRARVRLRVRVRVSVRVRGIWRTSRRESAWHTRASASHASLPAPVCFIDSESSMHTITWEVWGYKEM